VPGNHDQLSQEREERGMRAQPLEEFLKQQNAKVVKQLPKMDHVIGIFAVVVDGEVFDATLLETRMGKRYAKLSRPPEYQLNEYRRKGRKEE
jgi:hypothetical protein